MTTYHNYRTVKTTKEVNELQDKGWVTVERIKTNSYGSDSIEFIMGYPTATYIKFLEELVGMYEQEGFNKELFRHIAAINDEKYEDIEEATSKFDKNEAKRERMKESPTMSFMQKYEELVHNKRDVVFFNKKEEHKEDYLSL